MNHRFFFAFSLVALLLSGGIVRYFNEQPGFTDAFYHYNAAARIAGGEGFVDDYLWMFIGAPDTLPAPSHLYWMPGTTLIASAGMFVFGNGYAAAQIGLGLTLWGAALLAYYLGYRLGGNQRHAWFAGLMFLCGGFYLRFWGATDTFAPYAFFGALALVAMGIAAEKRRWHWWFLAGIFAAGGHLIRSDGLLLVAVGVWAIFNPFGGTHYRLSLRQKSIYTLIFITGYLLVMLPWFARNLNTIGTILPAGGTQALWYTEYNDLFNYPPDANPQTFFADGIGLLFESRWNALFHPDGGALWTFIAVEGIIALTPFILIGAWRRRKQSFLRGMLWFAIGIHVAFPVLFPFPGMRGGLFHAVAALMPWWLALASAGLDDVVDWLGKRRRHWRTQNAKWVFTFGLAGLIIALSFSTALPRRVLQHTPPLYYLLDAALPSNARVMINDPAQLYYFTKRGGITFPNEAPGIIPELAEKYGIEYVLLENVGNGGMAVPIPFMFDPDNPPPFLQEIVLTDAAPTIRLFRIVP